MPLINFKYIEINHKLEIKPPETPWCKDTDLEWVGFIHIQNEKPAVQLKIDKNQNPEC